MREYLKDPEKRELHRRSVYKSNAKRFVREFATSKDMKELNDMFENKGVN
nr:hypothetical protein LBZUJACN_LBZUJACN_CDS_0041 [Caudoviricetes sp.]CAI9751062.1 hypothetical protein MIHLRAQX_MIHLRAQX_CDS_0041 [Caudoviricetes sp.]